MKRSEMLLNLEKFYYIRHVMVEQNHLTVKEFLNELLQYIEYKGMNPPLTFEKKTILVDYCGHEIYINAKIKKDISSWEPENEEK